jgi:hypothetical protein
MNSPRFPMRPRCLTACVAVLAPAAFGGTQVKLDNDRLVLQIDLRLSGGRTQLRDLATGQVYEAADFGVVRVWDSTEDRMRTAHQPGVRAVRLHGQGRSGEQDSCGHPRGHRGRLGLGDG